MAWKQSHKIDEMATTDMVTNIIVKYQQRHDLLSNVGSEMATFEIQTRDMTVCPPPIRASLHVAASGSCYAHMYGDN